MIARTRYFVIASLLVLTVGVGTGLVAYYVGFPLAATNQAGPEELQYVPRNATILAYANVQDVMVSQLRQRLRQAIPQRGNGQQELQDATGIDIEHDIDRVVAFAAAESDGPPVSGMVLARGRFDAVKIEALMREHGAHVEEYKGRRLIVADVPVGPAPAVPERASLSLTFLEPGLVALGGTPIMRRAVDLKDAGGENVTSNDELMNLVRSLSGDTAWAVGRLDALRSQAQLPAGLSSQLPPINWFSVSGHINGGIQGLLRAETRDDESATNLREVVRGFMALAKMQSSSRPQLQALVQSLELGGAGKTVSLSFMVPAEVFDLVSGAGALK